MKKFRPFGWVLGKPVYDEEEFNQKATVVINTVNAEATNEWNRMVGHGWQFAGTALYPPQSEYIMTSQPDPGISVTFAPATRCQYCRSKVAMNTKHPNCPQCGAPLD